MNIIERIESAVGPDAGIDATGGFFPVVTLRLSDVRALLRLVKADQAKRDDDDDTMQSDAKVIWKVWEDQRDALAALEAPCDTETP